MTRKKVQSVLDWLDGQIDHPTPPPPNKTWYHLCLASVRMAWNDPPWATSANLWWDKVPKKYRHHTTMDKVPAGAPCAGLFSTVPGHAWTAGRGTMARRIGFTVDYRRKGRIDRAPLNLPNWTHDQKVWWTGLDTLTGDFLPLWIDPYNVKFIPKPAVYKGGK